MLPKIKVHYHSLTAFFPMAVRFIGIRQIDVSLLSLRGTGIK